MQCESRDTMMTIRSRREASCRLHRNCSQGNSPGRVVFRRFAISATDWRRLSKWIRQKKCPSSSSVCWSESMMLQPRSNRLPATLAMMPGRSMHEMRRVALPAEAIAIADAPLGSQPEIVMLASASRRGILNNERSEARSGILFVVATAIGQREDINPRALQVLRDADLVACEDTRRTGRLLSALGVRKPLVSYFEHNEQRRVPELIDRLREGRSIALVTDAGTP